MPLNEYDQPTPGSLGYRMPAEWEPQSATWLIWPEHPDHWFADLELIRASIARMAAEISLVQHVRVLVNDADAARDASKALAIAGANIANVDWHEIPTDLCWMRDCGPMFVVREQSSTPKDRLAAIAWGYNAWGGKYPPWDNDAAVATKVANLVNVPHFVPGVVMEGGSIETNGSGTILTTEQCLLNPNRNPHLSKAEIETYLREFVGCSKIIWLGEGIEGDDTDGHIDDISRFVAADTVLTMVEADTKDPNHKPLADNVRRLELATDANGKRLRVIQLPMPPAVHFAGQRFPASYANYYLANGKVIAPTFREPKADAKALELLAKVFPKRKVVGVDARELVTGYGAFHCFTQQQPRVAS